MSVPSIDKKNFYACAVDFSCHGFSSYGLAKMNLALNDLAKKILNRLKSCVDLDSGVQFLKEFINQQKERQVSEEVSLLLNELLDKISR